MGILISCLYVNPRRKRKKLDSRSTKGILVEYNENAGRKTYRIYNPTLNRVISSRDVIIDETATQRELENGREGRGEIQLSLPVMGEPEAQDEDSGRLLEPITPPLSGGAAPDLDEFGGDTIVVRPRTRDVVTTVEEASSSALRRSERQRDNGQRFARAIMAYIEHLQKIPFLQPEHHFVLGRDSGCIGTHLVSSGDFHTHPVNL